MTDRSPPLPALLAALGLPALVLLGLDLVDDLRHGGDLGHAAAELLAALALGVAWAAALRADRRAAADRQRALRAELQAFQAERRAAPRDPPAREPAPPVEAAPPEAAPAPPPAAPAGDALAHIEACFRGWGLTAAEQEVAFLLSKGVSLAEVAAARGTRPHTAKDQARAIYRKAGVAGRAELAAVLLDLTAEVADARADQSSASSSSSPSSPPASG